MSLFFVSMGSLAQSETWHNVLGSVAMRDWTWLLLICWRALKFVIRWFDASVELSRLCKDKDALTGREGGPSVRLIRQVYLSLVWSKQLEEERATLTVGSESEGVYERICHRKGLESTDPLLQLTLRPSLRRLGATFHVLHQLKQLSTTAYDRNNTEHEQLLQRLWKALMPNETLTARVTKQWEAIGFQGDDPATDFRGMGLLGLHALLHFAEQHRAQAQSIVLTSQHPTRWFPFAITGIQIAQMVLFASTPTSMQPTSEMESAKGRLVHLWWCEDKPSVDMYYNLFSFAITRFDAMWRSNGICTIVDFPNVFRDYQSKLFEDLRNHQSVPVL